ncbi:hypothetical protein RFI_29733 [Reticulomyxa filosa]|uniref:Uncharacterized protein n=1 Tax=Reticulomyxa filosa TaxID=46433 RepID=X6M2K7_RETFI|nr:hypothetical protein RFI_29733 [Reticulomyxa filosa]|eukprot:ETO07657.1 hypothetical protein RFI_29733 [Reticulomyxa filosa]
MPEFRGYLCTVVERLRLLTILTEDDPNSIHLCHCFLFHMFSKKLLVVKSDRRSKGKEKLKITCAHDKWTAVGDEIFHNLPTTDYFLNDQSKFVYDHLKQEFRLSSWHKDVTQLLNAQSNEGFKAFIHIMGYVNTFLQLQLFFFERKQKGGNCLTFFWLIAIKLQPVKPNASRCTYHIQNEKSLQHSKQLLQKVITAKVLRLKITLCVYHRVRTPGSRIVIQYLKKLHLKQRSIPKCADTGKPLRGLVPNRGNYKNRLLTTAQIKRKSVSRAYGGNLSHIALRARYDCIIYLFFFLCEFSERNLFDYVNIPNKNKLRGPFFCPFRSICKIKRTTLKNQIKKRKERPKKKVVQKKKPAPKPVPKAAPEAAPTEPRKPTRQEEKEKRKVKQAKKDADEQAAKTAPKKQEADEDGGKKKAKKPKEQKAPAKEQTATDDSGKKKTRRSKKKTGKQ